MFYSDVDGKERSRRDNGGNSWFVLRAADQDAGDVRNEPLLENASTLPLSITITSPSGSTRKFNQIRDYP